MASSMLVVDDRPRQFAECGCPVPCGCKHFDGCCLECPFPECTYIYPYGLRMHNYSKRNELMRKAHDWGASAQELADYFGVSLRRTFSILEERAQVGKS